MTQSRLAPLIVLACVLVAGCAVDTAPAVVAPRVSTATTAALDLEPADGRPLLRFEGLVHGGRPLGVDLASLDALPQQTLTVVEPFVKKSVTFEGVGFADLLDAAQATGTSLTVHALDDYEVTFEVDVLREQGALLATHADGRAIDITDGGPVRLVFPSTSAAGRDTDLWVWSIDEISVE